MRFYSISMQVEGSFLKLLCPDVTKSVVVRNEFVMKKKNSQQNFLDSTTLKIEKLFFFLLDVK